jgi:hypothetical protein
VKSSGVKPSGRNMGSGQLSRETSFSIPCARHAQGGVGSAIQTQSGHGPCTGMELTESMLSVSMETLWAI